MKMEMCFCVFFFHPHLTTLGCFVFFFKRASQVWSQEEMASGLRKNEVYYIHRSSGQEPWHATEDLRGMIPGGQEVGDKSEGKV